MIFYNDLRICLSEELPWQAREWRNNQEIFGWCRQKTLIRENDHEKWIENDSWNDKNKMFGIRSLIDNEIEGEFFGVCGFTNIDFTAKHAEFSLYIAPEFHGNSFGLESLYTLIRHGFEDFNFNKIWGETFENNPAMKIFENLGFEKTTGHKQHYFKKGKYVDTYFFNIFQSDFLQRDYSGILTRGLPTS